MLEAPKFGREDAILFAATTTLSLVYGIAELFGNLATHSPHVPGYCVSENIKL